jgi:hypothetical protein
MTVSLILSVFIAFLVVLLAAEFARGQSGDAAG